VGPEAKFYKKLVKEWREFSFTRLENISLLGTPDLLVCNNNGHFFTIELKVTKGKKVQFSPHQLSFHIKHPKNTFILIQALGPRSSNRFQMFRGSRILELDASGLALEACSEGLDACRLTLSKLGA
jgi:hypothetical protein|tara:strand:+ start:102 stop:479 length:378 start_codon:yes stop_codon:yes gene_type:complete